MPNMPEFEIILSDEKLLAGDKASYVDLPICVRLDERFFPDPEWTDMAYPILCMWAEALHPLQLGTSTKCRLNFLDGPWWLEVTRMEDALEIAGCADKKTRKVEVTACCQLDDLLRELLKALARLEFLSSRSEAVSDGLRNAVHRDVERCRKMLKNS